LHHEKPVPVAVDVARKDEVLLEVPTANDAPRMVIQF
jgi:hypothetical protein